MEFLIYFTFLQKFKKDPKNAIFYEKEFCFYIKLNIFNYIININNIKIFIQQKISLNILLKEYKIEDKVHHFLIFLKIIEFFILRFKNIMEVHMVMLFLMFFKEYI